MVEHMRWWFGPVVSLIIVLLGLAVAWGKYGAKIANNCRELKDLKRKVEKMTVQCANVVDGDQCRRNQIDCRESFEKKLDEQSKSLHGRIDEVIATMNGHMIIPKC